MTLHRIKLTLPPDLRAYVARRVAQGGCVNAGEHMRQLIRSDATPQQDRHQQDRRLGDRLVADETRRGGTAAGDAR